MDAIHVRCIAVAALNEELWALFVPYASPRSAPNTLEMRAGYAWVPIPKDGRWFSLLSPFYLHEVSFAPTPALSRNHHFEARAWLAVDHGFFRDVAFAHDLPPERYTRDGVDRAVDAFLATHTCFGTTAFAVAPQGMTSLAALVPEAVRWTAAGKARARVVPVFASHAELLEVGAALVASVTSKDPVQRTSSPHAPLWESALLLSVLSPAVHARHPIALVRCTAVGADFALQRAPYALPASEVLCVPESAVTCVYAVLQMPCLQARDFLPPHTRGDAVVMLYERALRDEVPASHVPVWTETNRAACYKAPSRLTLSFYQVAMEALRAHHEGGAKDQMLLHRAIERAKEWLQPIVVAIYLMHAVEYRRRMSTIASFAVFEWSSMERRFGWNPHTCTDDAQRAIYMNTLEGLQSLMAPIEAPLDPRLLRAVVVAMHPNVEQDFVKPRDALLSEARVLGRSLRLVPTPVLTQLGQTWVDVLDVPGIRQHALSLLRTHPHATAIVFPAAYVTLPALPQVLRAIEAQAQMTPGCLVAEQTLVRLGEGSRELTTPQRIALCRRYQHVVLVEAHAFSAASMAAVLRALSRARQLAALTAASCSVTIVGCTALCGPFCYGNEYFLTPLPPRNCAYNLRERRTVYESALRSLQCAPLPEIAELTRPFFTAETVASLRQFLFNAHRAGWWRSVNRHLTVRDFLWREAGSPPYASVTYVLPVGHSLAFDEMAALTAADPLRSLRFVYATQLPVAYSAANPHSLVLFNEAAHLAQTTREELFHLFVSMVRMRETQRILFLNEGGTLSVSTLIDHLLSPLTRGSLMLGHADLLAALVPPTLAEMGPSYEELERFNRNEARAAEGDIMEISSDDDAEEEEEDEDEDKDENEDTKEMQLQLL